MPEIITKIYFELWCAQCGKGLNNQVSSSDKHSFQVKPCETCLDKAKEKGFDKGLRNEKD